MSYTSEHTLVRELIEEAQTTNNPIEKLISDRLASVDSNDSKVGNDVSISLLRGASEFYSEIPEFVRAVWRIVSERLVQGCIKAGSIERDLVSFALAMTCKADELDLAKGRKEKQISSRWGDGWKKVFEENLEREYPVTAGMGFLKQLNKLSKILPLDQSIDLLNSSVARPVRGRNTTALIYSDIARAIETIPAGHGIPEAFPQNVSVENDFPVVALAVPKTRSVLCSCPDALKIKIDELAKADGEKSRVYLPTRMKVLRAALKTRSLCYRHLQLVASSGCGLHSQLPESELWKRIGEVARAYQNGNLNTLKASKDSYFSGEVKTLRSQALEPQNWQPNPAGSSAPLDMKQRQAVFSRFAGTEAWNIWERDGYVNIDNVMPFNNPELAYLIQEELNMYDWHRRDIQNGKGTMGWNRLATHALFMQACRQSLRAYALTAAARIDGKMELVSYPFYVKSTRPGESTGFRHLDVNVPASLNGNQSLKFIQTFITLLHDESPDNCTWAVPGFHKHLQAWWEDTNSERRHKVVVSGHTTTVEQYTKVDEAKYGKYVPLPSKANGLRLSRPDILHGAAAGRCQRPRLGAMPWFVAVQAGGALEIPGSHDWETVAKIHRDLTYPTKYPYNDSTRGSPEEPFAAAVKLTPCCAIADAVLCGRRWSDPAARQECSMLFGDDDEAAWQLVRDAEERLICDWKLAFQAMVQQEEQRFGENSYFVCRDRAKALGVELVRPAPANGLFATDVENGALAIEAAEDDDMNEAYVGDL